MTEERLKNIIEKEIILNKTEIFLKEANGFLTQWKKQQKECKLLLDYYYSEQWQKDFFASNEGKTPKNIPHGVLDKEDLATSAHLSIERWDFLWPTRSASIPTPCPSSIWLTPEQSACFRYWVAKSSSTEKSTL